MQYFDVSDEQGNHLLIRTHLSLSHTHKRTNERTKPLSKASGKERECVHNTFWKAPKALGGGRGGKSENCLQAFAVFNVVVAFHACFDCPAAVVVVVLVVVVVVVLPLT